MSSPTLSEMWLRFTRWLLVCASLGRQAGKQAGRQAGGRGGKQAGRQTEVQTTRQQVGASIDASLFSPDLANGARNSLHANWNLGVMHSNCASQGMLRGEHSYEDGSRESPRRVLMVIADAARSA